MEIDPWWLLAIPLFFVLGWLAARFDSRQAIRQARAMPDAYFRGLNHLLNDQPDKALDDFVDVARIQPEAIQLHFALGSLFRRRGETDRAIRVHQNLAARGDLTASDRQRATRELGHDYMKAGLLDRAEQVFNQLAGTPFADDALRSRLEIAQQVRDWPAAIALARSVQNDDARYASDMIAHFHCELAQAALGNDSADRFERADAEIASATAVSPEHPRPWMLAADAAAAQGHDAEAIDRWKRAAAISPAHIELVAPRIVEACERSNRRDEGLAWLETLNNAEPSTELTGVIARARMRRDGGPAAIAWTETQVERNPSLAGLDLLLQLRAEATQPAAGQTEAELDITRKLIHQQAARLTRYVCRNCGFRARQFYWQCPGCSRWDSYSPRRAEDPPNGRPGE